MNETFTIEAPAKLNLRLVLAGRRADGYHLLSMVNTPLSLCDRLALTPQAGRNVELSIVAERSERDLASLPHPERNSAVIAAKRFLETFDIREGLRIEITKRIPIGGGLGGGSADAAAVLRFLEARHRSTPVSRGNRETKLASLALELGADVPFALFSSPALVGGVGETITPVSPAMFSGWDVFLVLPPFGVRTAEVFAEVRRSAAVFEAHEDVELPLQGAALSLPSLIRNDLERHALAVEPRLAEFRPRLERTGLGAVGFSGSGSTYFVLVPSGAAADNGAQLERAVAGSGAQVVAANVLFAPPEIRRCGC